MDSPDAPNFFLLGAAKAGTTSLHHYLVQHAQIYLPQEKEIQFFTDEALFVKGPEFYLKHYFRGARAFCARGEATPLYFHRPELVAPRLKEYFGLSRLRFVVVLRNPAKRAWSHYQHMRRLGLEPLGFEPALEKEAARMREEPRSWFSYYSDGLYANQLEHWFQHFSEDRFLVLSQDDLIEDLDRELRKIFCFLGIDTNARIKDKAVKNEAAEPKSAFLMRVLMGRIPGGSLLKHVLPIPFRRRIGMALRHFNTRPVIRHSKMAPETEFKLTQAYERDLERLEKLLGRSFSSWRADPFRSLGAQEVKLAD